MKVIITLVVLVLIAVIGYFVSYDPPQSFERSTKETEVTTEQLQKMMDANKKITQLKKELE